MAAIAESVSPNETALPVCLGNENPHRLVSPWNIVNRLELSKLVLGIQNVGMIEAQLTTMVKMGEGNRKLPGDKFERLISSVKWLREQCVVAEFTDSCQKIDQACYNIREPINTDVSTVRTELRSISDAIFAEGNKRAFLQVMPIRVSYLEQDALFGEAVNQAFPGAARDIREAGNCLAVECGTACVFHSMRAAEVALRALAKDRQVQYPDASVSSKQVGDLLSALDGKLLEMRKADAKLWPSKDIKDAQIKFYHTAIAEVRDFNEAWRKSMAHGHEGAFYDPLSATSIVSHVRSFMQVLATKVSEMASTPLYWTAL